MPLGLDVVISFDLTNPLAIFMGLINRVFKPYHGMFVVVSMDDILIYFRCEEGHMSLLRVVLQTLMERKLLPGLINMGYD